MKRVAWIAAGLLGLAALALLSGVVPIKASSGHWRVTAWLLDLAKKRSVATHSLGIEAPQLDDPALVLKGARHYETGCRPCHGSSLDPAPRLMQRMAPPPPALADRVADWSVEELFYIVKHGVKFTGMPAWPAPLRDDEVWAVVAFLERFPGLDAAAYRKLAVGEVTSGIEASCARCHGADGSAFPRLAGQSADYLSNALEAYATGARYSGIMEPIAAALDRRTRSALAAHYAALPRARSTASATDPAALARGESLAHEGNPAQRIPPCAECHGPSGTARNPAYPIHAGQSATYLMLQLELLKQGRRGGSPYVRLMQPIASRLTREQMRDVALYYESLGAP